MTDHLPDSIAPRFPTESRSLINRSWAAPHYLSLAVVSVYVYVLMEWLFYVTKPSFMDLLQWQDKLQILFISPLPWVLFSLLATIVGLTIGALLPHRWKSSGYANLGVLGSSAILTVLAILIVDNFTWTLFKYGIATTRNFQIVIYLSSVLLGFTAISLRLSRMAHKGGYRNLIRPCVRVASTTR